MASQSSTPPLSTLTPAQQRLLTFQILTEHFTLSPETLAKLGMDRANEVLIAVINHVESQFRSQLQELYGEDEVRMLSETGLSWVEVDKAFVRIETLLESGIDKQFDKFELYILRNVFTIPVELIPYLVLKHQEHFSDELRAADEEAILEYEQELALYEAELENARALEATAEFVARKVETVEARQREIGYLKGSSSLSDDTAGLMSQVSLLRDRVQTLLDTPTPPTLAQESGGELNEPWAQSRAAFVNWAATEKVAKVARQDKSADGGLGALKEATDRVGKGEDALALLASLGK